MHFLFFQANAFFANFTQTILVVKQWQTQKKLQPLYLLSWGTNE